MVLERLGHGVHHPVRFFSSFFFQVHMYVYVGSVVTGGCGHEPSSGTAKKIN